MTVAEKLTAIGENMPRIYAAGQADSSLQYAARPEGLFWGSVFPAGYHAVVNMPQAMTSQGILEMFRAAKGLEALTFSVPTADAWNARHFLYLCTSIRELTLPEGMKFSNFESFVSGCSALRVIRGAIDLRESSSNANAFSGCTELTQVRFQPESIRLSIEFPKSQKLSEASVASILAGLATVETTQTLTLHDTVKATLTTAQIAALEAKNWQLL